MGPKIQQWWQRFIGTPSQSNQQNPQDMSNGNHNHQNSQAKEVPPKQNNKKKIIKKKIIKKKSTKKRRSNTNNTTRQTTKKLLEVIQRMIASNQYSLWEVDHLKKILSLIKPRKYSSFCTNLIIFSLSQHVDLQKKLFMEYKQLVNQIISDFQTIIYNQEQSSQPNERIIKDNKNLIKAFKKSQRSFKKQVEGNHLQAFIIIYRYDQMKKFSKELFKTRLDNYNKQRKQFEQYGLTYDIQ